MKSSVVANCAAMESASEVAAVSFGFDSTKIGGSLENCSGSFIDSNCELRKEMTRASKASTCVRLTMYMRERSAAEPVAHLSTHLHHALIIVVTRSVPKC